MFCDEFIFGEAFDVEEKVGREWVEETVAFSSIHLFLWVAAVVFGEDGGEGDLRDDVLFKLVLEKGRGGEI